MKRTLSTPSMPAEPGTPAAAARHARHACHAAVDGDCGLCTASARGWPNARPRRRSGSCRWRTRPPTRGSRALVAGRDLASTLHVVTAGRRRPHGRPGRPRGRSPGRRGGARIARLADHRLGHALLEPAYRRVAANRHRIGRRLGLPATMCTVPVAAQRSALASASRTDRPVGRSVAARTGGRRTVRAMEPARCPAPIPPSRAGAAASGSWTRRSTRFATRGYRDTAVDDIAGAAETSKGGIYFHFPTKEAIFRELMQTTADKLVGRVERAVALETEPVARAEAAIRTVLAHVRRPPDDGPTAVPRHGGRRPRLPGGDERAARSASRVLIQGYLDDAVAAGAVPPLDTRITSIAWFGAINEVVGRWLLADQAARLEDAYPALRAALLRSAGVPAERIGEIAAAGGRLGLPGGGPVTAVQSDARAAGAAARRTPAPALGERLRRLLDGARASGDAGRRLTRRHGAGDGHRPDLAVRRRRRGGPGGRALAPSVGGRRRSWGSGGPGRSKPEGPTRFRTAEDAWRGCVRDARIDRPDGGGRGTGPVLLGALGFTGRRARRGRRVGPVRAELARPAGAAPRP